MANTCMRRLLAALAFALLLSTACGGGGGGGSPPADAVAEGTITDTGSAAVTGTLFEFDADTEFEIDGVPDGGADDLAIGLQVRVVGARSGDTGTAHLVSFDDSLEGPVAAAVVIGDGEVKELTILG